MLTLVGALVLACSGVVLAQATDDESTDGSTEEETEATTPSGSSEGNPPKSPNERIPDQYIVVFKDSVENPGTVAREHARGLGLQLRFIYRNTIEGYAAVVPNANALRRIQNDERVAYVEQDQVVRAVAQEDESSEETSEETSEATDAKENPRKAAKKPGGGGSTSGQTLPWGLDKIDADTSSTLAGNGSGAISNVNAYIIDTGIDASHPDLNVVKHVNFASGQNTDCNGHGTHVAGTVAAKDDASSVVGVAPGAPLSGVKVLGCNGSGSWSGVIAGIDWVTGDASGPAVANMSLSGGAIQSVDDAVKRSVDKGIFYALAASNDGDDACNYSPARIGAETNGVMTVAATDKADKETSWSNYGSCVDIWAPGASILSTKKGGGTTTMSGTSMASPHVAGGGALRLSNSSASPSDVEQALKSAATTTANESKENGRTITRENVGGF